MGGTTSTRRAEVTAQNGCIDDDLIPKKPLGSHAGAKTVCGSHVFEVSGYSLRGVLPTDHFWPAKSAVFTVGGYDWQIAFFPGGYRGCMDHVAAFLLFNSKDKDIRARASFHLSLVDVTGSRPPHTMSGENEFDPERSDCAGSLGFMKRSELEASPYLRDDRLTIECVITVQDVRRSAEEPPSNILCGGIFEDPDMIFEVKGEDFPAHKEVLAMRSPVFKAELYGAMRENGMNRIAIGDMQPVVFEALLHFIYNDSLPAMDDLDRNDNNETIRHLLVAADRYAIDRLKIICESILCETIDVTTVMTTLSLANQHHCAKLYDACLQFIATLGRMQMDNIMASPWYAELKANSPLALVELWEKACSVGRSKSSFHLGSFVT